MSSSMKVMPPFQDRRRCGGGVVWEAIGLGRLLHGLMPEAREATALLALMLLQDSRRNARVDARGQLVTLEEQDRASWDQAQIGEGVALAEAALRGGGGGF